MERLDELYELAEREDILIVSDNRLEHAGGSGRYYGQCAITLNRRRLRGRRWERVVLAHELGHCITRSFRNIYAKHDLVSKHEYTANKWAVHTLVPFDDFCEALLNRISDVGEQAEYWDVPVDFVPIVHDVYQRTQWDDLQKLKQQLAEEDDW